MLPIVLPGIIGVALFGFTLSYDEFAAHAADRAAHNTLPLEIWSMTTNVTSPVALCAGHADDDLSFLVIGDLARRDGADPAPPAPERDLGRDGIAHHRDTGQHRRDSMDGRRHDRTGGDRSSGYRDGTAGGGRHQPARSRTAPIAACWVRAAAARPPCCG